MVGERTTKGRSGGHRLTQILGPVARPEPASRLFVPSQRACPLPAGPLHPIIA